MRLLKSEWGPIQLLVRYDVIASRAALAVYNETKSFLFPDQIQRHKFAIMHHTTAETCNNAAYDCCKTKTGAVVGICVGGGLAILLALRQESVFSFPKRTSN